MRRLLNFLWQEWKGLQSQIEILNADLEQIASATPVVSDYSRFPEWVPSVDSGGICYWERRSFQKGTGVCGVAGTGTTTMVNGRQSQTAGHQ
jgi:hypothetical protein